MHKRHMPKWQAPEKDGTWQRNEFNAIESVNHPDYTHEKGRKAGITNLSELNVDTEPWQDLLSFQMPLLVK